MPTVMIVDDSPTAVYLTSQALGEHGYDVIQAGDGEQALKIAIEKQPDIILLDVILPKLNGFHVCREIKAAPPTAHIPVIMITSKTRDRDRDWGLEQGADVYITKPVDPDELLAAVQGLMRRDQ